MFPVTLRVLLLRYVYTFRQRWNITVVYFLYPLSLCVLAVFFYSSVQMRKYVGHIREHDERSLLRIPLTEDCPTSGQYVCQLKIIVCPDGAEERQLMERVVRLLRLSNSTITYVDNADFMTDILVRWKTNFSTKGLQFHEINHAKLEYTIRTRVQYIPEMIYDWGDFATTRKFPSPMLRGPRTSDPYFNIIDDNMTLSGFLPLQVAVDKSYIEMYHPNITKEWILTSFPHPPYFDLTEKSRDVFPHRFYLIFIQYMLMLGITSMILVFASYTINDKRSGIHEWMCVNGAVHWMVNLSWLFSFGFETTILAISEMALLKIPTTNGPTIKYMSASVLSLVLIVYHWQSLCWVYLWAAVFKREMKCIVIVLVYWTFSPLLQWIPPDCFLKQGFFSLLPNAGMVLIFKSFQEFDGAGTVIDLSRLYTFPIHYLPIGVLLLIMLGSSALLIILSLYVNIVWPGEYGRAKPWHLFSGKEKILGHDEDSKASDEEAHFEEISSEDTIALECVGITKSFIGNRCRIVSAIKTANLKIPNNEITVLVGRNGAGKTALLSVLSGMYSPSSGHFYTQEHDVFKNGNMTQFQKDLGYCPQNNFLLDEFTVLQHLIMFGLLKGLTRIEAEENCKIWIERLDIGNVQNIRAKNLSGVTKRKLCLAIAMTGEHRYLFLDDPCAGFDVKTLKTFWNILLKEKEKCTIILATHNMDEAAFLGGWIALMSNGEIKACGSRSFLKKQLQHSHKLSISVDEKDKERVLKFIAYLERSITVLYETNNAVVVGVPSGKSKEIPYFLKRLESEFRGGISVSVSYVTMDEVLLTFVELKKPKIPNVSSLEMASTGRSSDRCGQIAAVFKKKFKWIYNQSLLTAIIFLVVLPMIAIDSTMYLAYESIGLGSSSVLQVVDLKLKMDAYSGMLALLSTRLDGITVELSQAMKNSGITYQDVDEDMVAHLKHLAKKDPLEYRSNMVFGFDSGETNSDVSMAYYSRNAYHSAPIAYSTLINAMLLGNASITTHNYPFMREHPRLPCSDLTHLIAIPFKIILGPSLLITVSYFVILPHIERQTLFKHLQLMTGLPPLAYWIFSLLFDMMLFSISCVLIIVILAAKGTDEFFHSTIIMSLIIVLLLYGISSITFAYACSFLRQATSIVVTYFVLFPPLFLLGDYILNDSSSASFITFFPITRLYFLPWIILVKSLEKISIWAGAHRVCKVCNDADGCEYISSHSLIRTLKTELFAFIVTSLVYFTFCLAMDHGFGRKLKCMVDLVFHGDIDVDQDEVNQDVANEKKRVKLLELDEEEDQPELCCDGLGKKYSRNVTAVQDVTFAHDRGNVLGLIGTNGSGKSSLLGMLSGLIIPTQGEATLKGKWELNDCEYKYIRNIGYCPQFEGTLPGLSGRDTLKIVGRLRGLKPSSFLNSYVDRWLRILNLSDLDGQTCEQYSSGNRRKLKFAIAMIGFPSVVLLDEATSGFDPIVQRRIWDILQLSRKSKKQAVVLTSNAVSECEAICDRVTILVNGKMKCINSVPTLKNTMGDSCTLLIKLQKNTSNNERNAVFRKILKESAFSRYAKLLEKPTDVVMISVKNDKINTNDVFDGMMKIKDEHSAIEDFTLTDTSFEEAFTKISQQSTTENLPKNQPYASPPKEPRKAPRNKRDQP